MVFSYHTGAHEGNLFRAQYVKPVQVDLLGGKSHSHELETSKALAQFYKSRLGKANQTRPLRLIAQQQEQLPVNNDQLQSTLNQSYKEFSDVADKNSKGISGFVDRLKYNWGASSDEKGWWAKTKRFFGLKSELASQNIKSEYQEIQKQLKSGSVSGSEAEILAQKLTELQGRNQEYLKSQETMTDVLVDIGIGITAALAIPFTGGISLVYGFVAGGVLKSGIKYLDATSNGREYETFVYDSLTGGVAGLMGPASRGMVAGGKTIGEKVFRSSLAGAIDGGATGFVGGTARGLTIEDKNLSDALHQGVVEGSVGALFGGVLGGSMEGGGHLFSLAFAKNLDAPTNTVSIDEPTISNNPTPELADAPDLNIEAPTNVSNNADSMDVDVPDTTSTDALDVDNSTLSSTMDVSDADVSLPATGETVNADLDSSPTLTDASDADLIVPEPVALETKAPKYIEEQTTLPEASVKFEFDEHPNQPIHPVLRPYENKLTQKIYQANEKPSGPELKQWIDETGESHLGTPTPDFIQGAPSQHQVNQIFNDMDNLVEAIKKDYNKYANETGHFEINGKPVRVECLPEEVQGQYGRVYQLTINDKPYALKIYRPDSEFIFMSKESRVLHGAYAEAANGIFFTNKPISDLSYCYMANPKVEYSLYEWVDETSFTFDRPGKTLWESGYICADDDLTKFRKNTINDIVYDHGAIIKPTPRDIQQRQQHTVPDYPYTPFNKAKYAHRGAFQPKDYVEKAYELLLEEAPLWHKELGEDILDFYTYNREFVPKAFDMAIHCSPDSREGALNIAKNIFKEDELSGKLRPVYDAYPDSKQQINNILDRAGLPPFS